MQSPARLAVAAVVVLTLTACMPPPKQGAPAGSYAPATFKVKLADAEETVPGAAVTAQFFAAEGVRPLLGRSFIDPEFAGQGTGVAILSHRYWVDRFASDPGVIGKSILVEGRPRTVVGVTPPTFAPENGGLLWIPKAP
jgi:hypothetical protein